MTVIYAQLVVLTVTIVAALIGIPLLWRGLSGRRVGDHPLCRRCGFDQTGRSTVSTRCAECGADLSKRKTIVIGQRRKRPIASLMGLVILCVGGWTLTPGAYRQLRSIELTRLKPLWWLERDAASPDELVYENAFSEIDRRWRDHQLSPTQIVQVTRHAYEVQADSNKPWQPFWGAWIEGQFKSGALSIKEVQRYVRQANFTFSLNLQSFIHRTQDRQWIVIDQWYEGRYGGFGGWVPFTFEDKAKGLLTIDGHPLSIPPDPFDAYHEGIAMVNPRDRFGFGMALPPDLPLGVHHLRLREAVVIREGEHDNTAELARYNVDLRSDFTYIDSITDVDESAALHRGLKVQGLTRETLHNQNGFATRSYTLKLSYHGQPLRVPAGFQVTLESADSYVKYAEGASLGGLALPSGKQDESWELQGQGGGRLTANRCTLRFTTVNAPIDLKKLLKPCEFTLLQDRFIIADVPIESHDAPTAPATP